MFNIQHVTDKSVLTKGDVIKATTKDYNGDRQEDVMGIIIERSGSYELFTLLWEGETKYQSAEDLTDIYLIGQINPALITVKD